VGDESRQKEVRSIYSMSAFNGRVAAAGRPGDDSSGIGQLSLLKARMSRWSCWSHWGRLTLARSNIPCRGARHEIGQGFQHMGSLYRNARPLASRAPWWHASLTRETRYGPIFDVDFLGRVLSVADRSSGPSRAGSIELRRRYEGDDCRDGGIRGHVGFHYAIAYCCQARLREGIEFSRYHHRPTR
jgi:hypothetical protein